MRNYGLLPALAVRETGPGTEAKKRKYVKHRMQRYPDEVLAGILWLQDQGWTYAMLRVVVPGLDQMYESRLRTGYCGKHVAAEPPKWINEKEWLARNDWATKENSECESEHTPTP